MRSPFRLAIAAALGLAALPAGATTVAALSLEQMTDASDLVVRGVVESTWVELDEHDHVWTKALVRVEESIKGSAAVDDYVTVEAAGGTIDGVTAAVPGSARYSVGEDTFLFLTDKPSHDAYGTVGMSMGKYTVHPDPRDGTPLVIRFTPSPKVAWDARFVPVPPVEQRVTLASMEEQVRARVQLGWDGKPIPGLSDERLRSINRLQPQVR